MKIVEFYRGERPNQAGVTLAEMRQFTLSQMEVDHDYIQWMFPSNEPSALNCDAPVLTKEESEIFKSDPELQRLLLDSFDQFLFFLGFILRVNESGDIEIDTIPPDDQRGNPLWWTSHFNHNMLRITRVIKCLRLTGNDRQAIAFYTKLGQYKENFSANTWNYWRQAAIEPLW